MSSSLKQSADQTRWDIYRFELVFFNSTENRWQLFQEEMDELHVRPKQVGAFYRQEIQAMLKAIRAAVTKQCNKRISGPAFRCSEPHGMNEKVKPDFEPLHVLFENVNGFSSRFESIKKKVESSLTNEALEPKPYEPLWNYIAKGGNSISLTRRNAFNLLSVLPIARQWDVYGRLYFPKKDMLVLDRTMFQRKFCYKLSFGTKDELHNQFSLAERTLGYPVKLEFPAAWNEYRLAGRELRQGYYDLVGDVQAGAEAAWYGFYGLLLDALQRSLGDEQGDDEQGTENVWIIAYPMRICGWDHLVQLYVRPPAGKNPNAWELEAEWEAQGGLCGNDNSRESIIFKECIRELLVQIRVAAFQFNFLQNPSGSVHSFCMQAHNLVRMEWLSQGGQFYGYPPTHEEDPTPTWGKIEPQESAPSGHLATISTKPLINANIPWEKRYSGPLDPLFLETGRQRLAEQFDWLNRRKLRERKTIEALRKF